MKKSQRKQIKGGNKNEIEKSSSTCNVGCHGHGNDQWYDCISSGGLYLCDSYPVPDILFHFYDFTYYNFTIRIFTFTTLFSNKPWSGTRRYVYKYRECWIFTASPVFIYARAFFKQAPTMYSVHPWSYFFLYMLLSVLWRRTSIISLKRGREIRIVKL